MSKRSPLLKTTDAPYCYIIAEAGVNHNGNIKLAHDLIDAAVEAGADAVKFQTFRSENLVTGNAKRAQYQVKNLGQDGSQLAMLKTLELSQDAHFELKDHCENVGIEFLSSPFDGESLEFLCGPLEMPYLKIPSGELTNGPFLLDIARAGKPMILSTGMATMDDIKVSLGVLAHGLLGLEIPTLSDDFIKTLSRDDAMTKLKTKVAILHCTTEYPAQPETINLRAIDTLRDVFGFVTGFSDHSEGIAIPNAAVARGAEILEKHMTLDKSMAGPDHKASINPSEFKAMVHGIRAVEAALGDGCKEPHAVELRNRPIARKALVASCSISKGEVFGEHNLTAKRVGEGMSPMSYWSLLGQLASRDYSFNEVVEE
jgi:N-acetylneuraminate synthase